MLIKGNHPQYQALYLKNFIKNKLFIRRIIKYYRLLLGSSSWYQGAVEKYTKGTGSYNKYHRGRLDGTLIIKNISYAEAGKYECVVNSAVGTIYAHAEGKNFTSQT